MFYNSLFVPKPSPEPLRLHHLRFIEQQRPKLTRKGLKRYLMQLYGAGHITLEECQFMMDRHELGEI